MKIKNNSKEKITKQRFDIFMLVDIALNLWIAYRFFQLWIIPEVADVDRIYFMAILMGFEFIMVHSGVMMAVMPFKFSLFFFFPVYGLFALAFNTFVPDNSILILYLLVVLNRMRFAFFNTSKEQKNQAIGQSLYAVTVYFFLIMGVGFFSGLVPEMGLNKDFLAKAGYNPTHGGLFPDEPQTAMCMGFFYYILLALLNIIMLRFELKKCFRRADEEEENFVK